LSFLVLKFILENIETLHGFSFSFQSSKRTRGMKKMKTGGNEGKARQQRNPVED
jgi:hypothetical protein